ncbi:RNA dependent RNA polymerase-domain-containing protein [Mycena crocata]|nr:RNA dependent RNA polymerase-domain-containing protein [Mycena crocata]
MGSKTGIDNPPLEGTEDSESEYWSCFDSSSTLYSSSPCPLEKVAKAATLPTKRKLEDSDTNFKNPPAKKVKRNTAQINFCTSVPRLKDPGPFIIAGFSEAKDQDLFSTIAGLSSGAQWEIARLVSMGRITDVPLEELNKLKGSSVDAAPRVIETILKEQAREISVDAAYAAERKSQCPWSELDTEEAAIGRNPNAALGNCPEYHQAYGGKVYFTGTVEVDKEKRVKIVLDRCTLSSSCRLYRRFGSGHFLRLRIPLRILHNLENGLREFFLKPFVLFGTVFRAFFAKEGTVVLFKTRERYNDGKIQPSPTPGLTLFEFLDEFNPLKLNSNQALCKWASRFSLGLSNSVPGPVLGLECIEETCDLVSSAECNMTDGCGLSNLAFNLKLRRDFNLGTTPSAVQIRHGGKKGMLLICPESTEDSAPRVVFRTPSQIKIVYSDEAKMHPANSTIDILRFSRTKCPARISPEVIVNLEHNGVPSHVFVSLQNAYIAEGVDDLLAWAREPGRDKPEFMFQLWNAVEKSEGVYFARRVREAAGEARFRRFGDRFADATQEDDEEEPEAFDKAIHERSTAWWPDYISGSPSSLAETVMTLLDAGFTPHSLPVLRDKLKQIVRAKIKYRSQHFRYEITHSASAFVVPDFWEVLEENEVHFKSSRREFQMDGDVETDIVIGDVLMTRNPCKVPTDVRKLKAVKNSKLHDLVDVIVCSVKGQRRLLDFLAGGDYDGDTAIVIWDKGIVDSFVNADEKFSIEPRGLDQAFTRDETSVAQFIRDNARTPPEVKATRLQKYLLGSLRDPSAVGQYSSYHDNAIITRGYSNPRTVKLAYKFCKILDSAKTGFTIKPETQRVDRQEYAHERGPEWKLRQKSKGNDHGQSSNRQPLRRKVDPNNPLFARPFIMDVLNDVSQQQESSWLREAEQLFLPFEESQECILDPHLTGPWNKFAEFAARRAEARGDMGIIMDHVREMYRRHSRDIKQQHGHSQSHQRLPQSTQSNSFTDRAIEVRQDALRTLSRDFAAVPSAEQMSTIFDPTLIARLRASYAYMYDHEQNKRSKGWSRFPWDMALGELCKIKAAALGSHKAVTTSFYERFKMGGERRS